MNKRRIQGENNDSCFSVQIGLSQNT